MVKYIFLFFLLVMFSGMDIVEIDDNLYVVSMGLDYFEDTDEVEVTLYFIDSGGITSDELGGDEEGPATGTFRGKNEIEIIRRIETTHNQTFQFTHMTSYIITKNYIENIGFANIIDSIRRNPRRHPNFYVFTTEENIENIYNHKNIDNISTFYSIIFNPVQVYNQHTEIGVKHISQIITEFYEDTLIPEIPLLRLNDSIWTDNNEQLSTLELYGYCYKGENVDCYDIYNDRGIKYTRNSTLFIETFEEYNIKVRNTKVNISTHGNDIIINVSLDYLIISNPDFLDEIIIENEFNEYIYEYIMNILNDIVDVYWIEDYVYRNNLDNDLSKDVHIKLYKI